MEPNTAISEHERPQAEGESPLKRQKTMEFAQPEPPKPFKSDASKADDEPKPEDKKDKDGGDHSPFPETGLERQLFSWRGWDHGAEFGDMIFTFITFDGPTPRPTDLKEEDVDYVEWMQSHSRVNFLFKDGTKKTYGLKVSLFDI